MLRFFTGFAAVMLLGTLVYGQQGPRDPKKEQVMERLVSVNLTVGTCSMPRRS